VKREVQRRYRTHEPAITKRLQHKRNLGRKILKTIRNGGIAVRVGQCVILGDCDPLGAENLDCGRNEKCG
jgi:hypothetical protein